MSALPRDLGRVLALKGDPHAALEAFRKQENSLEGVAIALHDLGRHEEFEVTFSELRERASNAHSWEIAYVYAWIGDADTAFEYLEKAFLTDRTSLSRSVRYPAYYVLHNDPRWHALLEKLGMSPEQLAEIDFKLPPQLAALIVR